MATPKYLTDVSFFQNTTFHRSKMTVRLDFDEMQLLEECCLFEPWLGDSISRARRTKKGRHFTLILEGDERTDVLSALEASAQCANALHQDDKSIDFSVLHDKIIVFTPEDFEIE